MLHDQLRRLIAVAGDVADREQIVAGAIKQDDAGVAQILIKLAPLFPLMNCSEGQARTRFGTAEAGQAKMRRLTGISTVPFPEILIIELRCGCLFVRYGKIVSKAKAARKEKHIREQITRTLQKELRQY